MRHGQCTENHAGGLPGHDNRGAAAGTTGFCLQVPAWLSQVRPGSALCPGRALSPACSLLPL